MSAFLRELRERLRWAPHNLVAHPLMTFLPSPWDARLHDATIPQASPRKEQGLETHRAPPVDRGLW